MIVLPKKIYLTAIGKHWRVSYVHVPGKLELVEFPRCKLVVYGKNYSKRAAIRLLIKWVKLKAQKYLSAMSVKLNRKIKVKYKKLRVRALIAGWGCCVSDKTFSLNYNLIFMPPLLVRHIIIHELCHIRYLDHSPRFWKEVAKYDKSWKKNKESLYDADIHIPKWAM